MVVFEEIDDKQRDVYRTLGGTLELIGRILRPKKAAFFLLLKKVILSEDDLLRIIGQMGEMKGR